MKDYIPSMFYGATLAICLIYSVLFINACNSEQKVFTFDKCEYVASQKGLVLFNCQQGMLKVHHFEIPKE